ncbi:MAG: 3-deoxy-D-manno-octulosonic acid transferase [Bacteroidales bacterium]|nr:3-deoxy-D-manno-octulosonic acid transferase [Bacteroidales bacterium]
MRPLYSFFIHLYTVAVHIAAIFGNNKAKLWISGRKNQKNIFTEKHNGKWIWFHVSSLGEFEQGRPLIEFYKKNHPDYNILLTFFSPSGFEIRKNYTNADKVLYLPADTKKNAKKLLNSFEIKVAFFVKYDFWFNYLHTIKERNIPLYLISGIFRKQQHFFKWYGFWQRKQLKSFTHFFLQNEVSKKLLDEIGFKNSTIAGDTRFDRVIEIASSAKEYKEIEAFIQNKLVYLAGSSWEPDEEYIFKAIKAFPDVKFIIVPHEIDAARIDKLINKLPVKASLYTNKDTADFNNNQVLIVNTIGMLSSLYRYSSIAHIGNGFGSGIHNTLEAAVYGIPVIFGPNYTKFQEAIDLIKLGGGFSFSNQHEYLKLCETLINDTDINKKHAEIAKKYVFDKAGATKTITDFVLL